MYLYESAFKGKYIVCVCVHICMCVFFYPIHFMHVSFSKFNICLSFFLSICLNLDLIFTFVSNESRM